MLERFRQGGARLVLLWWVFAMTAVLLTALAGILPFALRGAEPTLLSLGSIVGILAGVVQFLGLIRWPFLVPHLARADAEADATPAHRDAIDVVFQAFNRYLGVAVGEDLGLLFTGTWSILVGISITQTYLLPGWLGVVGIVTGAVLVWSLWLVITGVFLLLP